MTTYSPEELRWLYTALRRVEFLNSCNVGELEQLMQSLNRKHFPKGLTIVKQGEPGDYLFILYAGEVSIQVQQGRSGPAKEIARLGPGNSFGEMALISREPRSASVVTLQETDAFLLYSSDFRKLVDRNPELARALEDLVARRKADRAVELRRQALETPPSLWARMKKGLGL